MGSAASAVHAGEPEVGKYIIANGSIKASNGKISRPVKTGDPIFNDDTVEVGPQSSVKLMFSDQTMIDLGPVSSFKVSNYALKNAETAPPAFRCCTENFRSLVTKKVGAQGKVEYKSGSAVMGVRGTEFIVDMPKGTSANVNAAIVVVSGLVQVAPLGGKGEPLMLKSGEMIQSTSAAPQVTKVSGEQMQTMVSSTKTEDKTFATAVTIEAAPKQDSQPSMAMSTVGNLINANMAQSQMQMAEAPIQQMAPET